MKQGFRLALSALMMLSATARAHDGPENRTFSAGFNFAETTGEELFANVCQGCHMPNAAGATGAGTYPSLASDPNLESSAYGIDIVVNGRRAMPAFGDMMNDAQVAAVVNYLRTHFGNDYRDAALPKDVSVARR